MVDRADQVVCVATGWSRGSREAAGTCKVRQPTALVAIVTLPGLLYHRRNCCVHGVQTSQARQDCLRCIYVAVIRRGLDDRLAVGSLLLLLDVDVVRSIASTLDSPSVKRKMKERDKLVDLPIAKIPPEIVWPERKSQQPEDATRRLDGLNTPLYALETGAALQLQFSVTSQLLGGGDGLLDDDDIGLAFGLDDDDDDIGL